MTRRRGFVEHAPLLAPDRDSTSTARPAKVVPDATYCFQASATSCFSRAASVADVLHMKPLSCAK